MYTMKERKPIMLSTEVYIRLRRFIESYSKKTIRSCSFSDAIEFLLRKPFFIYTVDESLRDYILAFVAKITRHEDILGVLLFGSVAKGTNSRNSDIDIMIISSSGFLETLREISACLQELDSLHVELLLRKGLLMNIAPLIITQTSPNASAILLLPAFSTQTKRIFPGISFSSDQCSQNAYFQFSICWSISYIENLNVYYNRVKSLLIIENPIFPFQEDSFLFVQVPFHIPRSCF